jgi:[acyl-carrier-protein] S-malonyltransferase
LHTPILWERNIPNRAARMMHTLDVSDEPPKPPVLSMVTGTSSYTPLSCRETLVRWVDHPQRLWDVVYETLARGVETVIHVGPAPNIIPATFRRLGENITAQLQGRSWNKLGIRAVSSMARRQWLSAILPSRAALLRAPFLEHVILEDWLLAQRLV